MDIIAGLYIYIILGAAVGFLIGLTGVGGGSLMTPLLILSGIPYNIAIGTDLLYAAITKTSGVYMHHKRKTINWFIVFNLAAGSIPASIFTALVLKQLFEQGDFSHILTSALGIMLMITSAVLLFKKRIQSYVASHQNVEKEDGTYRQFRISTLTSGLLLGVCVTLSSVGAGAFGTAVLMIIYTKLSASKIIGTDLAHAVPLTLVAGMGHLFLLGHIDFKLLIGLLVGSLPAVYFGAKAGVRLPDKIMFQLLAAILLILGIRFAFF
jgi:hypothetical protein